jgi:hypothetical protein
MVEDAKFSHAPRALRPRRPVFADGRERVADRQLLLSNVNEEHDQTRETRHWAGGGRAGGDSTCRQQFERFCARPAGMRTDPGTRLPLVGPLFGVPWKPNVSAWPGEMRSLGGGPTRGGTRQSLRRGPYLCVAKSHNGSSGRTSALKPSTWPRQAEAIGARPGVELPHGTSQTDVALVLGRLHFSA